MTLARLPRRPRLNAPLIAVVLMRCWMGGGEQRVLSATEECSTDAKLRQPPAAVEAVSLLDEEEILGREG